MSKEKLQRDYDLWHSLVQFSGSDTPLAHPWYRSAFPHIKENAVGQLLEVGCGRGEFAVWLANVMPYLRISAVDFSSAAIALAKRRAGQKGVTVDFFQDDAQALKFPNDHFDYLISCECMEHVSRPRAMASEIFRVLKPNGRFCLTTENYFNGIMIAWLHAWIMGKPFNSGSGVQPLENFFFFWQVRKYLQSAGLIIDRTESCHVQWMLFPGVDPRRLCTDYFSTNWSRALSKPFGRHFSFFGYKPVSPST